MIKYKTITFVALATVLLLGSCKKESKVKSIDEILRPASMTYTKADTAAILEMVDQYKNLFIAGDFSAAADMLYYVKNDSVFPLDENTKKVYTKAMSQFHFFDGKLKGFLLRSDKNNEMKLLMQIAENGNLEEERGVTTLSLNPVVKDGKWYLTLLDEYAEGVEDPYEVQLTGATH